MSVRRLLPPQLGGTGPPNQLPPPVNDTGTTRKVLRGERDPRDEVVVWKDRAATPQPGDSVSFLDDLYNRADRSLGGLLPGGSSPTGPGGIFGPLPGGQRNPLGPIVDTFFPTTPPIPPGYGTGGTMVPGGVGAGVLSGQLPLVTDPIQYTGLKAPKGYTLIRNGEQVVAVLSVVAYALGLKKRPRARGGISGRELEAARKVQGFITKHSVARKPKVPLKKRGK